MHMFCIGIQTLTTQKTCLVAVGWRLMQCICCSIKVEIHTYHAGQVQEWSATSAATTAAAVRLHHAEQLVQGLGLQVPKRRV